MREAIGGSLMMYLVIPIIVIFIFFIAFIMNYASAYRAANYVITQIENCQGQMKNCNGVTMSTITSTVKQQYKYVTKNGTNIAPCYIQNGSNTNASYVFRVELPVSFELPLLGEFSPVYVKAETKSIRSVPSTALAEFSKCP